MNALQFTKYHGAGNDFVVLDGYREMPAMSDAVVAKLCDRHFGIGADGLIIVGKHPEADYEMHYFNADGNRGSMCGNGARCAFHFAMDKGYAGYNSTFIAWDGPHTAALREDGLIGISMRDVGNVSQRGADFVIDTGSPHFVRFVDDATAIDVVASGRQIRYSPEFAASGINVNFVSIIRAGKLRITTYERGVENRTLACGTGATAAALAYAIETGKNGGTVQLVADGGELVVSFEKHENVFRNILLSGSATSVFTGAIEI